MAAASVKEVFEVHMPAKLKGKADLTSKVNAVYQFNISGPDGGQWSVDCTTPGGSVTAGSSGAAGCTVVARDADFLAIVTGKLNPQMAFLAGKIKVQGDIGLAMRLQHIL